MRKILALTSAILLSACGGATELDAGKAASGNARVVVAVIDSAMNPYHEYFYAGSPLYPNGGPSSVTPQLLAEIGVPPENVIELTRTRNFAKDRTADAEKWKKVRRGRPYWFKGTNLIGISFSSAEPYLMPTSAAPVKNPHGVGTSASVLQANPDAVILFVETWDNLGDDAAHAYAFLHPAVDIISTSYGAGIPFAPIGTGAFLPEVGAFASAFDGVVKMGKLHFSSGGNAPGFTPGRAGAGPWWSIGVSGITEGEGGGKAARSGDFPDFVSDFLVDVPYCVDCERGIQEGVGGTSFSTPRAAGVFSRVLLEARRALGHGGGILLRDGRGIMAEGNGKSITNWQLRRALEEAAYVPTLAEYDPVAAAPNEGLPPVDPAPWLTFAWGDLTALPEKEVVKEALAQLGFGTPTRTKSADFCDFQTKVIEERKVYWSTIALDSGDHVIEGDDPFLYCGSALPALPAGAAPGNPLDLDIPSPLPNQPN